jgi:cbb3-type cytochrome oxidase subunit 3
MTELVYLRSVYLFCHLTCLSSLCVFALSFDLFIFVLCICAVIWLVYLRSVRAKIKKSNDRTNTQSEDKQVKWQNKYTERRYTSRMTEQIHRTCLSSFCVFVLSFDFFIFALCICSVIWLVYLRSHRAKINKSNDRTNTQNEDKQVKWQNKYTERR